MPNGGVPINLEFCLLPTEPGQILWHQQGKNLNLYRITGVEPLSVGDLLGSIEIEITYLAAMVNDIVSPTSRIPVELILSNRAGVEIRYQNGLMSVSIHSEVLGALSGGVLRAVAAFMAYWVDHDAEVVSDELELTYRSPAFDLDGSKWLLNPSY